MLQIILGITGGIAAYKATGLIRQFSEAGHQVKVIPTANALRFVGAATLEALSHNSVDPDLYTDVADVKHVSLGQQADLVVVAPATANFIAKFAAGIADDLLGNTLLVADAPILIAPAMHTEMWLNDATQANVALLRSRGITVLEPASGRLTGDDTGVGRLPDPEVIYAAAMALLAPKQFSGQRFVVTAGGTREPIDPVRYIGNRSSGKQGIAIAKEAAARGASVTLIGANLADFSHPGIELVHVETAVELEHVLNKALPTTDCLIMAAAVSDFHVAQVASRKIKRSVIGDEFELKLVANPDILAGAVSRIRNESLNSTVVGFAAETAESQAELLELAANKLKSKGCDFVVANNVLDGAVFDADDNSVVIVSATGVNVSHNGSKQSVAAALMDILASK